MGCSNTTNLTQVDGGVRVKQGDLSSTFGFELQDENFRGITSLEGQEALITLTKDKYCWKKKALVKDQAVSFNLDSILPYRVEISAGGYIFPSDRKTYIEIEASDKELVLEVVHTLKELDIAEEVKRQLSEGGACPEIPDLLMYYNLGKV